MEKQSDVQQVQTEQVTQEGDAEKLAMENMELRSQVKAKEQVEKV